MDSIDAGGGTNIWLDLDQGLNSLKADQMGGRMAHVMLMTSGQTTNRGTLMSNVAEYRQKHQQLPGTMRYEQIQSVVVMVKPKGADAQLGGKCSSRFETK